MIEWGLMNICVCECVHVCAHKHTHTPYMIYQAQKSCNECKVLLQSKTIMILINLDKKYDGGGGDSICNPGKTFLSTKSYLRLTPLCPTKRSMQI